VKLKEAIEMSDKRKGVEVAEDLHAYGNEQLESLIENKDLEGMVEVIKEEPRRIEELIEKINRDKSSVDTPHS